MVLGRAKRQSRAQGSRSKTLRFEGFEEFERFERSRI